MWRLIVHVFNVDIHVYIFCVAIDLIHEADIFSVKDLRLLYVLLSDIYFLQIPYQHYKGK